VRHTWKLWGSSRLKALASEQNGIPALHEVVDFHLRQISGSQRFRRKKAIAPE
jgi:hypothetical protein